MVPWFYNGQRVAGRYCVTSANRDGTKQASLFERLHLIVALLWKDATLSHLIGYITYTVCKRNYITYLGVFIGVSDLLEIERVTRVLSRVCLYMPYAIYFT